MPRPKSIEYKTEIPTKPRAGIWGNNDFWMSYMDLFNDLCKLIPNDCSSGNLSLPGVAARARTKCKAIVMKAKIMEDMMRAITIGRK